MKLDRKKLTVEFMRSMVAGVWSSPDFDLEDEDDTPDGRRIFREHAQCLVRDAQVYADVLIKELKNEPD